ncbi:hypothetical protein KY284_010822 [Solanum tuberosum]|nr:hypothetical protein KY284_010822 [Solanum tuberosum]
MQEQGQKEELVKLVGDQSQHMINQQQDSESLKEGKAVSRQDQVNANSENIEVMDVESSSHFSFGVKATDQVTTNLEKQQSPGITTSSRSISNINPLQEQHRASNERKNKIASSEEEQAGKPSNFANSHINAGSLGNREAHGQSNAKGKVLGDVSEYEQGIDSSKPHQHAKENKGNDMGNKDQFQQAQHRISPEQQSYQNAFPKKSNNFEKPILNNQKIQQNSKDNQPTENPNPNLQVTTKKDQPNEPAPYTIVQSFVARLRHNLAKTEVLMDMVTPKVTTKQGLPAVIFDMDDFMTTFTFDCKHTLVGKFSNTMPKVELIRKKFHQANSANGGGGGLKYSTAMQDMSSLT